MLYADSLSADISKERDLAVRKLEIMRSEQAKEEEKVDALRNENNNIEKKIKRYRGLVQEQIDKASAKKRGGDEDGPS